MRGDYFVGAGAGAMSIVVRSVRSAGRCSGSQSIQRCDDTFEISAASLYFPLKVDLHVLWGGCLRGFQHIRGIAVRQGREIAYRIGRGWLPHRVQERAKQRSLLRTLRRSRLRGGRGRLLSFALVRRPAAIPTPLSTPVSTPAVRANPLAFPGLPSLPLRLPERRSAPRSAQASVRVGDSRRRTWGRSFACAIGLPRSASRHRTPHSAAAHTSPVCAEAMSCPSSTTDTRLACTARSEKTP